MNKNIFKGTFLYIIVSFISILFGINDLMKGLANQVTQHRISNLFTAIFYLMIGAIFLVIVIRKIITNQKQYALLEKTYPGLKDNINLITQTPTELDNAFQLYIYKDAMISFYKGVKFVNLATASNIYKKERLVKTKLSQGYVHDIMVRTKQGYVRFEVPNSFSGNQSQRIDAYLAELKTRYPRWKGKINTRG